MQLKNALKRIMYNPTTYFTVKQGSTSLRGISFVDLYVEMLEYPVQIIALDIKVEKNIVVEWRICADGEKVFPFADTNTVLDGAVNIIPVEVAAGKRLSIEVRGKSPKNGDVVILKELDLIYRI